MRKRITDVPGLSDAMRFPRLGVIRLGVKVPVKGKKDVERPKETPYFVLPDELEKKYGKECTKLPVMLPVDNDGEVFPVSYRYYGSGRGLKCQGDGDGTGYEYDDDHNEKEKECPCELAFETKDGNKTIAPKCAPVGFLYVILWEVSVAGVYQVTTRSRNSIMDIRSGIGYARHLAGRANFIKMVLERREKETHHKGLKSKHYTLHLTVADATLQNIAKLQEDGARLKSGASRYALPPPRDVNPKLDKPGDTDEVTDYTDSEPLPDKNAGAETAAPPPEGEDPVDEPNGQETLDEMNRLEQELQDLGMTLTDLEKARKAYMPNKTIGERVLYIGRMKKQLASLKTKEDK